MTPEDLRPDDFYYGRKPEKPKRDAKAVPAHIERHVFLGNLDLRRKTSPPA